jgi:hypothetical protein
VNTFGGNSIGHCEEKFYMNIVCLTVGRDRSVGIATRYGLDGPGIEFRWRGEIFRTRPDRPLGLPILLCSGYRVFPVG